MASKDIAEESARLQHLFNAKICTIEAEIAELKEIADKQNQIMGLLYSNSAEIDENDPSALIKSQNERRVELVFAKLQNEKCLHINEIFKTCGLSSNEEGTARRIMDMITDKYPVKIFCDHWIMLSKKD